MSDVEAYLARAMAIPGAVGAGVVDYRAGTVLGARGTVPDGDALGTDTTAVLTALTERTAFTSAGTEDALEDLIITSASGYHLIRALPTTFDARLALYLWLDRRRGNLAGARRTLQDVAADLIPG